MTTDRVAGAALVVLALVVFWESRGLPVVLPHIKAGKLRALAGWGDKRVAALPEVPTFKELGFTDAEFYIWAGVFAPRGTPEPVLAKLRETLRGRRRQRLQERDGQARDPDRVQARRRVRRVLPGRRGPARRGRPQGRADRGEVTS
ncbi:MAG: hypothetical protein DME03_11505 [Candidatus Rokuibacteriota bacterium]|nr:MAG: hypothetical protein DME03_11505 [Candidatus Rokubacteria bacterium]